MVLVNIRTGHGVAAIPSGSDWSVGEWLGNQSVEVIRDKNDPRWSDGGDNIIINGERCRLEDLAVIDQTVSDTDLAEMFAEALDFYEPHSYREANYMSAYGTDSPDTYAERMCGSKCFTGGAFDLDPALRGRLFNQFLILLSIANDPFISLLERMHMTPQECSNRFSIDAGMMQEWIDADRAPHHVRLMMAEATGLLKLRNLA